MTPRNFGLKAEGWLKGREADQRLLAWASANVINGCGHVKRPVTVDDLLGEQAAVRDATDEEKDHFATMKEKYR